MQDKDKRKLIEEKLKTFGKTITATNIVLFLLTLCYTFKFILLILIIGPPVYSPMQFQSFVSPNSAGRIVHCWISPCPWGPTCFFLGLQWLAIFVCHCHRALGGGHIFSFLFDLFLTLFRPTLKIWYEMYCCWLHVLDSALLSLHSLRYFLKVIIQTSFRGIKLWFISVILGSLPVTFSNEKPDHCSPK